MPTSTAVRPLPMPAPSPDERLDGRGRWTSVLLPLLVGLTLGPVDLLLQHVLPYPFANLANSPATWALVAFAVGWYDRVRGWWWPAAAGTLTLLLAVEGYYLTAALLPHNSLAALTNPAAMLWLAYGAVAGVVFGTAGSWARSAHRWRAPLGTATAVAVLLAEAWTSLARAAGTSPEVTSDPGFRQDLVQTALVLVVLAGVTTVLAGRTARQRVVGLTLALPLALAGALAFGSVGLG